MAGRGARCRWGRRDTIGGWEHGLIGLGCRGGWGVKYGEAHRKGIEKVCGYPPLLTFTGTVSSHVLTPSQHLGLSRDCSRLL